MPDLVHKGDLEFEMIEIQLKAVANFRELQSIYVTRDRVILKFEARVQIYEAVLKFGCEIQNAGGNVVSFSKINSCEISF